VTVIHLVRVTNTKMKGATTVQIRGATTEEMSVPGGKKKETLNAFCKDCMGYVPARVILQCPDCKEEDKFHLFSGEVIDHVSGDISSEALKGSCTKCCKDGAQATVIYCCKICDNKPVALLRQIRDNIYSVPCMVCTLKK